MSTGWIPVPKAPGDALARHPDGGYRADGLPEPRVRDLTLPIALWNAAMGVVVGAAWDPEGKEWLLVRAGRIA